MIRLYRRHKTSCKQSSETYRRCSCPVWCDGTVGGFHLRQSMKTTNWERALEIVRDWEIAGRMGQEVNPVTIQEAVAYFIADCQARKLAPTTLRKFHFLLEKRLINFCTDKIEQVRNFTPDHCRTFRESWNDSAVSANKNLERLKGFFQFCVHAGWIAENPAEGLKRSIERHLPTLSFTKQEFDRILAACDQFQDPNRKAGGNSARRIKAFILLLRYSGLRISDALRVGPQVVDGNRLFLYQQKTREPVYVPLPPKVIEALHSFEHSSFQYYFWTGRGSILTRRSNMARALDRVFKLAGINNCHAHRFRDTFAVELLQRGVPIETVSVLLGHTSIRITEKHYAPWVAARQQALEKAVALAWDSQVADTPVQPHL